MRESISHTSEAVTDLYDQTLAMEIIFGPDIHLGYWPEGVEDGLDNAQKRLTDLVAASAAPTAGTRILDVGCGTGGPARHIAATTGAAVTGVTISPKQVEVALARNDDADVDFHVGDATDLPFAEAEFDAAVAIESLIHIADKQRALNEVFRVLRPGATLVVADLTQSEGLLELTNAAQSDLRAMATLLSPSDYRNLVAQAGFEIVEVRDIGPRVRPSWAKLVERATDLRQDVEAADSTRQVTAVAGAFGALGKGADAGFLGYVLLIARKPASP
ncbi:SAM-dependent methyltransferase [Nocardia takedensis]|uniref:methyltransferase domain-containing protein n=1 Tax=Nocardia takedensis TaxID=259390 RepID=UPI000311CC2B|nr:methyltransferase domain-containing protein [Nocardia takedensis]